MGRNCLEGHPGEVIRLKLVGGIELMALFLFVNSLNCLIPALALPVYIQYIQVLGAERAHWYSNCLPS